MFNGFSDSMHVVIYCSASVNLHMLLDSVSKTLSFFLPLPTWLWFHPHLFISRIMQKLLEQFTQNSVESGTWAMEDSVRFWW